MVRTSASIEFSKPVGFIVLEGVNGSGKSTLQAQLHALIERSGKPVVSTFEPGATPKGKALRQLLLEDASPRVDPVTELLLFVADRREHITKIVAPALSANKIVLCDRYIYSTIAFQGYGRGLDRATIDTLNTLAIDETLPDVVLLLDLDPQLGLERTRARRAIAQKNTLQHEDSFEKEALAFHTRLRDGFLALANERSEPFVILDASKTPEQVFDEAAQIVMRLVTAYK